MRRTLAFGLVVVGGLLLVVAALVGASFLFGPVTTDEDAEMTVRLAMLGVPVADGGPILEHPDQFVGVPHQEPRFDASDLGPELSFRQDPADLEPLDREEVLRAVYLGHDQAGEPYYLWHVASEDLRRLLGQILVDGGSFGRLGTSYDPLIVGDGLFSSSQEQTIGERGLTNGFLTAGSNEPTTLVAEWHALPPQVAAVVFIHDGEPLGWQNPVSGTAALRIMPQDRSHDYDVEMVALTPDGNEWNRMP